MKIYRLWLTQSNSRIRYVVHNVSQSKLPTQKFTPEIYKFNHKQKRPYTLNVNRKTPRVTKCYRSRELNLRSVSGAQANRQRACLIRLAGQSNTCNTEQQPVWYLGRADCVK